jgi:Protein of unknown function (DUF2852)
MSEVVAKLDDMGQAAWIAVMVLGFVLFWPIGLSILAYLLWSGRMGRGCNSGWHNSDGASRWERKMARFQDKMERWQARSNGSTDRGQRFAAGFAGGFASSGNRAFDEYRAETLRRLEEEHGEFKSFLDRLREAKDKAEFDQFMADRRNRPVRDSGPDTGSQSPNPGSNQGPGDYPFGGVPKG